MLGQRSCFLIVCAALFASCATTSTPVENPPPVLDTADAAPDVSDAAPAIVEAAPALVNVRLEPVEVSPSEKSPVVEIVTPIAEQSVPVPKAMGLAFRLSVEGWPLEGLAVAIDTERPRRYVKGMKLGELLLDATAIAEGPHVLSVAAVRENGEIVRGKEGSRAPFAMVRFYVGARQDKPEPPRVILFEPSGTYNGEARADGVRIDFLAAPGRLGAEGGRARVTLKGPGVSAERELSTWQPLAIRDLPSGDFDVEVSLLDAKGQALADSSAVVRRTISVNRDGPVPKPE